MNTMRCIYILLSIGFFILVFSCNNVVISDKLLNQYQEQYELNLTTLHELENLEERYILNLDQRLEYEKGSLLVNYAKALDTIQEIAQDAEFYIDSLLGRFQDADPREQQIVLTQASWNILVERLERSFIDMNITFFRALKGDLSIEDCERKIAKVHEIPQNVQISEIANIEVQLLLITIKYLSLQRKLLYWDWVADERRNMIAGSHCLALNHGILYQLKSTPINPEIGELYKMELGVAVGPGGCFTKNYTDSSTRFIVNESTYYYDEGRELDIQFPHPQNGVLDSVVIEAKYEDRNGIYHHLVDTFYYQ